MKRLILAALMLLSGLSYGAARDVAVEQRNDTNNGWITRLMASPPSSGVLIYNTSTLLPQWATVSGGLSLSGSTLVGVEQADWNSVSGTSKILNRPTLAPVAISGDYGDLSGKPSIPAVQVNADWSAVSGVAQILNKPTLFSGAYGDLTGLPSTFAPSSHTHAAADIVSGTLALARIPSLPISQTTGLQSALDAKFATPSGTTSQYLRGDGSVATFPSIPASQVNSDWNSVSGVSQILNKPVLATVATTGAYADLTGKPTIPTAQVNADWNAVSGVAQILNKPTLNSGTVTSVTAGTGLSGGTITTTGTISLPNTGTAGTYATVTTDAQGRVTSGTGRSFTRPARTLNTAFQISATRDAWAVYTVDVSVTSLLLSGTSGRVYLEYADNSAMTTNLVTVNSTPNATGGVLNVTNLGGGNVTGWIPAGKWARIRTVSVTGTPTFTIQPDQQEVLQ